MKLDKPQKKTSLVISVTFLVAFLLGVAYVQATAPSTTFTISSGIYPGAPSYTIYGISGTYYAKDQNGYIEFSGADLGAVVNSAIDAGGLSIEFSSGVFVFTTSLVLDKPVSIYGQGYNQTILRLNANLPYFLYVNSPHVRISNFWLDGNSKTATAIYLNGYGPNLGVLRSTIEKNYITRFLNYSIWMNGEPSAIKIYDNIIVENKYGVLIASSSDNEIVNNEIGAISDGPCLSLSDSAHNVVSSNIIYMAGFNWVVGSGYTSGYAGIQVYGARYEQIYDNRINDNGGEGIQLYNANYSTIQGGYVSYNDRSQDNRAGLRLTGSFCLYNNINGITFNEASAPSPTQDYGVLEDSNANFNSITSVNAWNMLTAGIVTSGANTTCSACFNGTTWVS